MTLTNKGNKREHRFSTLSMQKICWARPNTKDAKLEQIDTHAFEEFLCAPHGHVEGAFESAEREAQLTRMEIVGHTAELKCLILDSKCRFTSYN